MRLARVGSLALSAYKGPVCLNVFQRAKQLVVPMISLTGGVDARLRTNSRRQILFYGPGPFDISGIAQLAIGENAGLCTF